MNRAASVVTKAAAILLAVLPSHASACTVCMGADGDVGEAVNGAIFLMLGCIGTMLASLAGFAFYLMRRANAPLSSHLGAAQLANDPEGQI